MSAESRIRTEAIAFAFAVTAMLTPLFGLPMWLKALLIGLAVAGLIAAVFPSLAVGAERSWSRTPNPGVATDVATESRRGRTRQDCLRLSEEILNFVTEERKLPEQDLFGEDVNGFARVIHSTAHSYRLRFEESTRLMTQRLREAGIPDERLSRYTKHPPADIYEVEALGGLLRALAEARTIDQVTNATPDLAANRADTIYASLVRAATDGLRLTDWDSVSDNALRGMLSDSFVEGATEFAQHVFRTVWPGTRPTLESEVRNLSGRVDSYLRHFMTRGRPRNDGIWSEDKSWKQVWVSQAEFQTRIAESEAWERQCSKLLWNVVVALNAFARAVRQGFDPDFFLVRGHFVISDSLGVTNRFDPTVYLPGKYRD